MSATGEWPLHRCSRPPWPPRATISDRRHGVDASDAARPATATAATVATAAQPATATAATVATAMTSLRLGSSAPCTSILQDYALVAGVATRPFNHKFMPGGERPEFNLRIIRLTGNLGRGRAAYRRAAKHLLEWRMHGASTTTGVWRDDQGALITYAKMAPGVWVLNPCRTLSPPPVAGRRETTVAYATTRGHLIAGVELMTVTLSADGAVSFVVDSRSRGAGLVGRAIFPLLGSSQRRFFSEQVRCMEVLASSEGAR